MKSEHLHKDPSALTPVRLILLGKRTLLFSQPTQISHHPSLTTVCKAPNCFDINRIHNFKYSLLQLRKGVFSVLSGISFHCCPVILNVVELAVVFWIEDNFVTSFKNDGLKH